MQKHNPGPSLEALHILYRYAALSRLRVKWDKSLIPTIDMRQRSGGAVLPSPVLLSLIGKINIVKIKILPVLLYVLRHSPVWVPKKFFKQIDSLLFSFLWKSGSPHFSIKTLRRPWTQGDLACPDLQKYFLAAFLTHAHNWVISDDTNSSVVLEAAYLLTLCILPY